MNRQRSIKHVLAVVSAIAAIALLVPPDTSANVLGRDDEAVVLLGGAHPSLSGMTTDRLVAFRWDGGWTRIPVQVDERAIVDFATIYGDPEPSGFTVLTYTDSNTFTGPDPDSRIDADDEIVFMARDGGAHAPAGAATPAGSDPESGIEVTVIHPDTGATAWVYLFRDAGTLSGQSPSKDVSYRFALLSGDYKSTYDTNGDGEGGNPESSTVTTSSYRVGFADRWMRIDTGVLRGGAPGTDLLERHRNRFGPDSCSRTEWTFSMGEGAFIVNKDGPVRALRGYVGANSGVTTYRIHSFYESTEVIRTVLRVHRIPGILDIFDWDVTVSGMVWRSSLHPEGLPVDGRPDAIASGPFSWESLSGPQGSIAMVPVIDTDIPEFLWTTWYSDSVPSEGVSCAGQGDDNREYGSSGIWRKDAIPNTDPSLSGPVHHLSLTRTLRYLAPDAPASAGPSLRGEVERPVEVEVASYVPSSACSDGDGDGWALCSGGCGPPAGTSCGDCDDADARIHPGAAEACNRLDDDCDGLVDESTDTDADTVGDCQDNCVYTYNPNQSNLDGDAFGDVCDCTPGDATNPPPPPLGKTVTVERESGARNRVRWLPTPEGEAYNVYRGWFVPGDTWRDNHQCLEERTGDLEALDGVTPRPGVLYYYLVSAHCGSGSESSCDDVDGTTRTIPDPCPAETYDTDGDGQEEARDNCPGLWNASQFDRDDDSRGDACDNCMRTSNLDQSDLDRDGLGNVCDPDQDDDGILDDGSADGTRGNAPCIGGAIERCDDNCPATINPDQLDTDADGVGDACDSD